MPLPVLPDATFGVRERVRVADSGVMTVLDEHRSVAFAYAGCPLERPHKPPSLLGVRMSVANLAHQIVERTWRAGAVTVAGITGVNEAKWEGCSLKTDGIGDWWLHGYVSLLGTGDIRMRAYTIFRGFVKGRVCTDVDIDVGQKNYRRRYRRRCPPTRTQPPGVRAAWG